MLTPASHFELREIFLAVRSVPSSVGASKSNVASFVVVSEPACTKRQYRMLASAADQACFAAE